MGSQVEKLVGLVDDPGRFDIPYADLRAAQVEAANERFQDRLGKIKLLAHRAGEAGLRKIGNLSDLVPLLFAHTTYKSYAENLLLQGNWERMGRWLQTQSAHAVTGEGLGEAADLDDWLARLEAAGYFVSCSSGTTGKCSMILASARDRAFIRKHTPRGVAWSTGIALDNSYRMVGTVPVPRSPRNSDVQESLSAAFGDGEDFSFPGPKITIGQVSRMVAMRKAIADGTAAPSEIESFERIAAEREVAIAEGIERTVEALIAMRGHKLFLGAQYALTYRVAQEVRARGYSAKDFHPENFAHIGGGLKGAVLPEDYREFIDGTFNLGPARTYRYYGMQEINSNTPICRAQRYHVPPWLILLLLDQHGDELIPPDSGEQQGRAGFFDLSIDGRWGGVISGDRITVRYGKCDCGHQGPTIGDDVVRYADLGDGDKITCAGTIDAYVRGIS